MRFFVNYDVLSCCTFQILPEEIESVVKKLPNAWDWRDSLTKKHNLRELNRVLGVTATELTVRRIPSHLKRSRWDSAKLLIWRELDGSYWGKRFTNNQKWNLWTE